MIRHWKRHVLPIINTVKPRRLIEIGADWGWTTREVLAWCKANGGHLDVIDPSPRPELHEELAKFSREQYTYHPLKSLQAIGQLLTPDIALIDGDHNWYTVYNELLQVYARAHETGAPPPICIMHDVAWPYARRDMYYNPDDIPTQFLLPHAYRGMLPDVAELTEDGMNGVLANALQEGGPKNGVMTAIEDYVASSSLDIKLFVLPFHNGLGILVPAQRMTPELQAVIDGFFSSEQLMLSCLSVEKASMQLRAILEKAENRLKQRTEALERARELLAKQKETIERLEKNQAAKPA
jgi:hypothetical protein